MRNISVDTPKNASITHYMTVCNGRIANTYFIFILKCQFSIWAYLSRWRMQTFFKRIPSGHFGLTR